MFASAATLPKKPSEKVSKKAKSDLKENKNVERSADVVMKSAAVVPTGQVIASKGKSRTSAP